MRTVEIRDDRGAVVGWRMSGLGHLYDPSYSTRTGAQEHCVCGRPRDHVFHRHTIPTRRAA